MVVVDHGWCNWCLGVYTAIASAVKSLFLSIVNLTEHSNLPKVNPQKL